jgi:hypothetical protein
MGPELFTNENRSEETAARFNPAEKTTLHSINYITKT